MSANLVKLYADVLKTMVAMYDELLVLMQSSGKRLDLLDAIVEFSVKHQLSWSALYVNGELHAQQMGLLYDEPTVDGVRMPRTSIAESIKTTEPKLGKGEDLYALLDQITSEIDPSEILSDDPVENEQVLKVCGIMAATFFNTLAIMIHGRSMEQLVQAATLGDDEALCLAVQIDKTTLQLQPFQDRLLRSQFTRDDAFLKMLGHRISNPLIHSKIRYRTLRLVFSILEGWGLLDSMSHEELFDLCEELGVYGSKHGVEDVGSISKRLRDYRRLQRTSNNI